MKWISVEADLPPKDFKCCHMQVAVCQCIPAIPAKGFFGETPERKQVFFAFWSCREKRFPKLRTPEQTVYEHQWGFMKKNLDGDEEFLDNIVFWMPLPEPPEKK
jgi:hypothetical protein